MTPHIPLFVLVACLSGLSQCTGFGHAVLVLPLLVSYMDIERAVPMVVFARMLILLPGLVGNARHIAWKNTILLLVGGAPLGVAGALLFATLPTEVTMRGVGCAFLFFALSQHANMIRAPRLVKHPFVGGATIGFLSGATGSAGPFIPSAFLRPSLSTAIRDATSALTLLAIYGLLMATYQRFIEFNWHFWQMTLTVTAATATATWCVNRREPQSNAPRLQRAVETGVIIIAAYMLVHGHLP